MRILRTTDHDFAEQYTRIAVRGGVMDDQITRTVETICRDVSEKGDAALFEYTERFDGYRLEAKEVAMEAEEMRDVASRVSPEDNALLECAACRIEDFHRHQIVPDWMMDEGDLRVGQRIIPLARVGIYCPGGKAAYPSTVLMAAIPAALAGVKEIVLASPLRDGEINPLVVAAARIGGVTRIYKVGGAQAIAAMAYGTDSIPAVDKIVGPGNAYVAAAKRFVYGQVAIDMIAGPSEVLIVSDGRVNPVYVAADLLAQAEHDEQAAAVLLTPDEGFARKVAGEVAKQMHALEREAICRKSLTHYGACIITRDLTEAIDMANRFAPEHLELATADPEVLLPFVQNAGAVFLGSYTPETMGDYLAGTNHILPTGGTARFSSALGVYDFVKRMSVVSFTREALEKWGPWAERFALKEGLTAHGRAVEVRLAGDEREKS